MITREFEVKGLAERGIILTKDGRHKEALKVFDSDICTTLDPVAMSYYAMCLAKVEARYDKAISLCVIAAEKEFFNPEIYLNLGRIFLATGQKSKAIKTFKRGLKMDDSNDELLLEMRKLGLRRRPFISWLGRNNSLNIFLGKAASVSLKTHIRYAAARQ
ncbi:MAG: hypothetical protein A3J24_10525 [Deltaproteobacteria bacterium RIFCSPLOWO2_02_FULL_53_8]|nr:MAG: hypothetical protein A3J24_10525 [Deltaproteobacteria bacterium RIFCSPLOWO2_02_FULL_53_8]